MTSGSNSPLVGQWNLAFNVMHNFLLEKSIHRTVTYVVPLLFVNFRVL
jgi:hypothetical protein